MKMNFKFKFESIPVSCSVLPVTRSFNVCLKVVMKQAMKKSKKIPLKMHTIFFLPHGKNCFIN